MRPLFFFPQQKGDTVHTFTIGANDAGQRADKFLLKACPQMPKSLLYKAFRKKDIKANGKRIPPETFLQAGDVLQVYLPDDCFAKSAPSAERQPRLPEPVIVYEDSDIAILHKPVNLPVHADDKGSSDTLIARFLQHLRDSGAYDPAAEQSFTPALCNRLDRNTEGLVIGAKNAAALRCINEKIRSGEIVKEYLCITAGIPPKPADTVTAYHRRLPGQSAEISDNPREGFSEIRTGYQVLRTKDGLALMRIRLYTGRTHQIRVQTAALGCPVLGDMRYGNRAANEKYGFRHQLLCAFRLTLDFSDTPCPLAHLRGKTWEITPDFAANF